jgi:hypothetical protein
MVENKMVAEERTKMLTSLKSSHNSHTNRTVIKSHIEKLYVVTIVTKHLYDRNLKEMGRMCRRVKGESCPCA